MPSPTTAPAATCAAAPASPNSLATLLGFSPADLAELRAATLESVRTLQAVLRDSIQPHPDGGLTDPGQARLAAAQLITGIARLFSPSRARSAPLDPPPAPDSPAPAPAPCNPNSSDTDPPNPPPPHSSLPSPSLPRPALPTPTPACPPSPRPTSEHAKNDPDDLSPEVRRILRPYRPVHAHDPPGRVGRYYH